MASCHSIFQVPTFLQTFTTPRASVSILTTYRFINKVLCSLQTKMPLQSYVLYGVSVIVRDHMCIVVIGAVLSWPLMEAKGLLWNDLGCAKNCGQLAPCNCRNPENGIPSVFLRKGQRTLGAWEVGKSNLPRQGTAQGIVGEAVETKMKLLRGPQNEIFSFSPKHKKARKPCCLVLLETLSSFVVS